jgi:hypothetical protein
MYMIVKSKGDSYERIPGTPLFDDVINACAYAKEYMESHPKDFQAGLEAIQVRELRLKEQADA